MLGPWMQDCNGESNATAGTRRRTSTTRPGKPNLWPAQSRMTEAVAPRPGERVLGCPLNIGKASRQRCSRQWPLRARGKHSFSRKYRQTCRRQRVSAQPIYGRCSVATWRPTMLIRGHLEASGYRGYRGYRCQRRSGDIFGGRSAAPNARMDAFTIGNYGNHGNREGSSATSGYRGYRGYRLQTHARNMLGGRRAA